MHPGFLNREKDKANCIGEKKSMHVMLVLGCGGVDVNPEPREGQDAFLWAKREVFIVKPDRTNFPHGERQQLVINDE